MELGDLEQRLRAFARAMYDDDEAAVSDVHKMPGHAGFSYGFTVQSKEDVQSWYLRLPPPKVKWRGTADVLRQVTVLNTLDGGSVPHCSVRWSGDDLEWFGRPYFIVPRLEGDVLGYSDDHPWCAAMDDDTRRSMGRQCMTALADIHTLDWERDLPSIGPPISFEDDVVRWDTFYERRAEPGLLARVPETREKLLARTPENYPVGVFHGDYQWTNMFFSYEGQLLAVVDWELVGVGATLNDVGWIATFSDPEAWELEAAARDLMPGAEELVAMYAEACGQSIPDINWYRALAAYKFAIISGFNLDLHRRGKRVDPYWEKLAPSMETLIERALWLLD